MVNPRRLGVSAALAALLATSLAGEASAASPAAVALAHKEANEINLSARDLPGWASSPDVNTPQGKAADRQLAICAGSPDPARVDVAHVNSPSFDKGNADINSNVTLVVSKAAAQGELAAIRSKRFVPCVQKELPFLRAQMAPAKIAKLVVTPRVAPAWLPPASFAYRLEIAVKVGKASETLVSNDYGFLVGRSEVELSATYQGATNPALETRLGKLLVQRADRYGR